jgi:general secretion pathway protein L
MTGSVALQKLVTISSESAAMMKRIAEPLRKILFFSLADETILPKRALSLSIEQGHLSIVYGSRFFSRIKVKAVRTSPFEEGKYPTPANVASALAMARNELKAFRSEITLSMPKAWVVARSAELPITVKENLADVVSYELDRLTPFTSDNAFYDFRILGEEDRKLNIMLIAAKADLINPYLEAIKEKGIRVDRVTVSPSAIGTFCSHGHGQESTVFANVSAGGYEVGLILDSLLTSLCAGNIDANDETAGLDAVVEGIHRCAVTAAKRGGTPRIVLCAQEGDLSAQLKRWVPSAVDLFEGADTRLKLPEAAGRIPPAAAGSMLESLWPQAKGFNLLEKGRRKKAKIPVAFTMVLLLALLALGIAYIVAPLQIEQKRLEDIDRRVAAIRPEVKKVEALKKEVEALETEISTINNFKKGRPMALQILKELTAILPKNAWLTRARVTDTTVEIEGYAASATELLSKLEASPYLKKVEFASPTFRDVRLNSDRFVIKMEIETPGKQEEGKVKP